MGISFSEDQKIVHIRNASISYVMEVVDGKYLIHRYFGKPIRKYRCTFITLFLRTRES